MTPIRRWRARTIALGIGLALAGGALLRAQTGAEVADLRAQLRARYDVVKLQQGVALVPHARGSVGLIQIVNGVVTVDGEALTGRQLTEKLGRDANLIMQVSYLDKDGQTALTAPETAQTTPPVTVDVPPAQDATMPTRPRPRFGDIVRIGERIEVASDERVDGEVVAIMGNAEIDGEVMHDVTVILGTLTLGPHAVVRGDIAIVGGRLNRAADAIVLGKIDDIAFTPFPGRTISGGALRPRGLHPGPIGTVGGSVTRFGLLVLLGLVAIALGDTAVHRIGNRAAISPVRAGLVGLLAELLLVPAIVAVVIVLAISIVGIPLLLLVPFGIGVILLLMLLGFVGAAYQFGVFLTRRTGVAAGGSYLTFVIGILAVMAVTLVARVLWATTGGFVGLPLLALGYLLEYLAWTVGFGAVILTWLNRGQASPHPAPTASGTPPIAGTAEA